MAAFLNWLKRSFSVRSWLSVVYTSQNWFLVVNISSKGIEVFNCDKFNILFGKALMIYIYIFGSFAAKISKQPLKNKKLRVTFSFPCKSAPGLKWLGSAHHKSVPWIFVAEIFWRHSETLPNLTIDSIIWNKFFRHTQPDVLKQNDSEHFYRFDGNNTITSVCLPFQMKFWRHQGKKDYILCLIFFDCANAFKGEDVQRLQITNQTNSTQNIKDNKL